jgi:hypothetical protein
MEVSGQLHAPDAGERAGSWADFTLTSSNEYLKTSDEHDFLVDFSFPRKTMPHRIIYFP